MLPRIMRFGTSRHQLLELYILVKSLEDFAGLFVASVRFKLLSHIYVIPVDGELPPYLGGSVSEYISSETQVILPKVMSRRKII